MTIHGQLTAEDCRPAHRVIMRAFLPVFLVILAITALGAIIGLSSHIWLVSLGPAIFPGFFLAQYLIISRCSPEFYARHFANHALTSGPREIKCKPEGISITGPSVSRYIKLDRDVRTLMAYEGGLIIVAPFSTEIFPRRWFTDEAYTQFQDYLNKGQNWRGWISYLWRS